MHKQKIIKIIVVIVLLCFVGIVIGYCSMQDRVNKKEQDTTEMQDTTELNITDKEDLESGTQDGEKNAVKTSMTPDFIPFGEEWIEGNIGITVLKSEYIKDSETLSDGLYGNPDDWQMGDVGEQTVDPGNINPFYFLTLQIINYSDETIRLWDEDNPNHNLELFGMEKASTYIVTGGNIVFCNRNEGNTGEALHVFGNFELQPGETAEVIYGFHVYQLGQNDEEIDWYLGDARLGLEMDVKNKKVYLLCVKENQAAPELKE